MKTRSRLLSLAATAALAFGLVLGAAPAAQAAVTETDQVGRVTLTSPLSSYNISSHYGPRCPIALGVSTFHDAVDMASAFGNRIVSIGNGTVESYVTSPTPVLYVNYGQIDGKETVVGYAHMNNPVQYVKVGQKVSRGQHIADVSDAGIANGPHLHFSVELDGESVDPVPWMKAQGVDLAAGAGRVVQKQNITSCEVYTTSKTGLFSSPEAAAQSFRIVDKDTKLTLYPGKAIDGAYNEVKTSDGKIAYIHAGRTYTGHAGNNQPAVAYGSTKKGQVFLTLGNRYLFSYPGTTTHSRGILTTVPRGERVTTTGRTANGYIEVGWKKLTGWVAEGEALESTTGSVELYRFWSSKFGNAHFYTASASEAEKVKADTNWKSEGRAFRVWPASKANTCANGQIPVYRFYSSHYASHFYTVNKTEADKIRREDRKWSYEGVAFCETNSKDGTRPVYRFWSPTYGKHFYTTNETEMKKLRDTDRAWSYEGVAWYAPRG